jgi:uncharacterized protein RhaS with RHS repeats
LFVLAAAIFWLVPSALAFRSPHSVQPLPTSPLETRVGVFNDDASGLFCSSCAESLEIAAGCEGCGYETALGRWRWLNHDPLGELGGINLYGFVYNDPVNTIDPYGEAGAIPFPTWVWPKSPNPVNCAFAAGAAVGTGLYMLFPDAMTKPGEWVGNWWVPPPPLKTDMGMGGKRGWAGSNPDPGKAAADKAAGRDRATGKRDRAPQDTPIAGPQPPDPLRGQLPKPRPGQPEAPPKDLAPPVPRPAR